MYVERGWQDQFPMASIDLESERRKAESKGGAPDSAQALEEV